MNPRAQVTFSPSPSSSKPAVVLLIVHAILIAFVMNTASGAHGVGNVGVRSTPTDSWTPPIPDATQADVLNPFIPPAMPWSSAHRGIDIQATGGHVASPADGEVVFVGTVVDRPVLTVRHSNGLLSSFEPVESDLQVGNTVTQGEVIGTISSEISHCEVSCVHWGVRQPDAWHIGSTTRDLYIDPAFLLGWSEPSVLWPLHSDPVS